MCHKCTECPVSPWVIPHHKPEQVSRGSRCQSLMSRSAQISAHCSSPQLPVKCIKAIFMVIQMMCLLMIMVSCYGIGLSTTLMQSNSSILSRREASTSWCYHYSHNTFSIHPPWWVPGPRLTRAEPGAGSHPSTLVLLQPCHTPLVTRVTAIVTIL